MDSVWGDAGTGPGCSQLVGSEFSPRSEPGDTVRLYNEYRYMLLKSYQGFYCYFILRRNSVGQIQVDFRLLSASKCHYSPAPGKRPLLASKTSSMISSGMSFAGFVFSEMTLVLTTWYGITSRRGDLRSNTSYSRIPASIRGHPPRLWSVPRAVVQVGALEGAGSVGIRHVGGN